MDKGPDGSDIDVTDFRRPDSLTELSEELGRTSEQMAAASAEMFARFIDSVGAVSNAFQQFGEAFAFGVNEGLRTWSGFMRDLRMQWPPPHRPIRDKSKGGWIAWSDGRWRKCERFAGSFRWTEEA